MVSHPVLDTQSIFSVGIRFGPEEDIAPSESSRRRTSRASSGAARVKKTKAEIYEELKDLKVNPNKATADDLRKIPGIGALTAQRIIDYRDSSGGFRSAEDLMNVPRMTKRTLEKIRPYLVFDDSAAGGGATTTPSKSEVIETAPAPSVTPPLSPRQKSKEKPAAKPSSSSDEEEYPSEPSADEEEPALVVPPTPPARTDKTRAPSAGVGAPAVTTPGVVVPVTPSVPSPAKAPVPSLPATQNKGVAPAQVEKEPVPKPPVLLEETKPAKEESAVSEDMLDINSASAQELEVIGFTSSQARNIIRYRTKEGGFSSVDDLLKVPGVYSRTLDKVRDSIAVK